MASLVRAAWRGLTKRGEASLVGWDYTLPPNWSLGWGKSGVNLGDRGVLALAHVYICVKAIAEDVSSTPFKAWSGDRYGARQKLAQQPAIVSSPFGPNMTAMQGLSAIVVSLLLRGNAYLWVTRWNSATGMPLEFRYASNVAQYGSEFFENAVTPSGFVSVKTPINSTQAEDIKRFFKAQHAGVRNAHEVGILGGGAEFHSITISPEAAQMLATRAMTREEIGGVFGVPLSRAQAAAGNQTGGGKGLASITEDYVRTTLNTIFRRIEEAFDPFIEGGDDTFTQFDIMATLLKVSLEAFVSFATAMRSTGTLSINELRAYLGRSPIDNPIGDDHGAPLNSNSTTKPDGTNDNGGVDESPIQG